MEVSIEQALQIALRHHQAGQLRDAEAIYSQIRQVAPGHAGVLHLSGVLAYQERRLADAAALIGQAVAIQPSATYLYDLGVVHQDSRDLAAAEEAFRRALDADPQMDKALLQLGNTLKLRGRLEEAATTLRVAQERMPGVADVHGLLAHVLQLQGKIEDAVRCYGQALALQPDNPAYLINMAHARRRLGDVDEAVALYRKLLAINGDNLQTQSSLISLYSTSPDFLSATYLQDVRRYGELATSRAVPYTAWRSREEPLAGKLRIGVVSGDLYSHPVGYFLEDVVRHADATGIAWIAYADNTREDETTARLRSRFAGWTSIAGVPDEQVAQRIHAEGIHILVDLAGHTVPNRLPVFAWKPAPVQASWLGYFASTGLPQMDYLLVDPLSVKAGESDQYTEALVFLPETRLCFAPPTGPSVPDVGPLPALRNGFVTLGCFQGQYKLNAQVLAVWAQVMALIPSARFRLQTRDAASPANRDSLLRRLVAAGLPADRVTVVPPMAREEYLRAYAEVDFLLDTFPYPGGTTTCEALWMGVPTLVMEGDTLLSRQGGAMMRCAGLPDWVAGDDADYVRRAVAFAADIEGLARLRAGLRQQVAASPLMDGGRFAGHLADAFRGMWEQASGPTGIQRNKVVD